MLTWQVRGGEPGAGGSSADQNEGEEDWRNLRIRSQTICDDDFRNIAYPLPSLPTPSPPAPQPLNPFEPPPPRQEMGGVNLIAPATVSAITWPSPQEFSTGGLVGVELSDGRRIRTRLLVCAPAWRQSGDVAC